MQELSEAAIFAFPPSRISLETCQKSLGRGVQWSFKHGWRSLPPAG